MGTLWLILGSVMLFLAGTHYSIWKIDNKKPALYWSISLVLFGLYMLVSSIGRLCSV